MGRFNKLLSALQSEPVEAEQLSEAVTSQSDASALDDSLTKTQITVPAKPQFDPSATGELLSDRIVVSREQIIRDPYQVRKYFDLDKLNGLAQTIAEEGVLEDLAVYELADRPGYYQLVFGERRYRASGLAGLSEVPVRVIAKPDHKKLLKLQLIENKHHEDLNPIEEVEGVLALLSAELEQPVEAVISLLRQMDNDIRRSSHNVMGQPNAEAVIRSLEGLNIKWRSFVLNQLPLLKLSEDVLEPIRQGKIEYTKALTIARLPDLAQRQQLLQEAMTQNLSIRSIRERIKAADLAGATSVGALAKAALVQDPATYAKRLTQLGNQLKKSQIWQNRQKREQLDQLLQQIEMLVSNKA
ncbi:MAG: ParB/RepB/Spo0J family partition protein [Pegethrix bostrychoides GSE-TBD4-15B]|jgi:ParB family chromosome partitioning protein|uniref:ParB/RepB/Spo0J family partition protein n=1 Tax=Pegethrix bostrychoides GSE-TBD4-15B TaxID=2839662 RepID=A0A951P8U9_9CYAN|nr:ParB/RepB/Spo0J family partition protein [Pegethrix bostrychoides GSE-TBD4-15B]